MNVELLEKVKRHILEEPKRLDMNDWVQKSSYAPCGTVACIAGWATLFSNPKLSPEEASQCDCFRPSWNGLGLNDDQSERLFYEEDWPEPFSGQFLDASTVREKAEVTAARIDHFIKTKGAE